MCSHGRLAPPRTPTPLGQSSISTGDSVTTKGWRAKSSSSSQSQIRQKTPLLEKHWWGGSSVAVLLKIKAYCSCFLTGKLSCYYLLIALSYCILKCCRFSWLGRTSMRHGCGSFNSLSCWRLLDNLPEFTLKKSPFLLARFKQWSSFTLAILTDTFKPRTLDKHVIFWLRASGCMAWKCIERNVYETFTAPKCRQNIRAQDGWKRNNLSCYGSQGKTNFPGRLPPWLIVSSPMVRLWA